MSNLEKVVEPLLQSYDDCIEAVEYCYEKVLQNNYTDVFYELLKNIKDFAKVTKNVINPFLSQIRKNALIEMCDNIIFAIDKFSSELSADRLYPEFTFYNEIRAPFLGLFDALKHAFLIYPNPDKLREFWNNRDECCKKARELNVTEELEKINHEYEITIVVMTFNLLDYFSNCFESLLKYTDVKKHKVQFIVFDHGSTDDTLKYMEQYKDKSYIKVHHCKNNIKNELVFMTNYSSWYDTKYTMVIANDTLATKNYLENLLTCIKSDDRIAWICPSMCNTSNNQSIPVNYSTIEEMFAFAEDYNKSDLTKWVELSRLIPVFSMYNNVCYKAINFTDPSYYEFFYGDDDMSRSFIRSGFRIIVCKDTYIHHYPSLTVHKQNNLDVRYDEMRSIFFNKFGYDAWAFQTDLITVLDNFNFKLDEENNNLLFIEPNAGQIVKRIITKAHQQKISLDKLNICSITRNKKYKLDVEGYSNKANIVDNYLEVNTIYESNFFDMVFIPENLEKLMIDNYHDFFSNLNKLLKKDGKIVFALDNLYHYEKVLSLITQSLTNNKYDDLNDMRFNFLYLKKIINVLAKTEYKNINAINLVDNNPNNNNLVLLQNIVKSIINKKCLNYFGIKTFVIMAEKR